MTWKGPVSVRNNPNDIVCFLNDLPRLDTDTQRREEYFSDELDTGEARTREGDHRAFVRCQNTKHAKLTQSLPRHLTCKKNTDLILQNQTRILTTCEMHKCQWGCKFLNLFWTEILACNLWPAKIWWPPQVRGERRNSGAGEQDADNYNYLRSQSVIISSRPFFSLPKSECARSPCPAPSLSPQLVKTHQSLVWGGDSRGAIYQN